MVEEGYAFPQRLAVASDSHSNMYGGIGCLGTPVVRTDAVALWVTGRTWWQVPPVAKLQLYNRLPPGPPQPYPIYIYTQRKAQTNNKDMQDQALRQSVCSSPLSFRLPPFSLSLSLSHTLAWSVRLCLCW